MRALVQKVSQFVEAGGVLLWSDWENMPTKTQAAFVAVQRRRRVEDAMRVGTAAQGPLGVLKVGSEIDGGQGLEVALLEGVVAAESQRGPSVAL